MGKTAEWVRQIKENNPEKYFRYLDSLCSKNVCVDHAHTTGEIRGILCKPCNCAIGYFKDNAGFVKNAAKYLRCGGVLK